MINLRGPSLIHSIADPSIWALVSHHFSKIISGEPYDYDQHGYIIVAESGDSIKSLESETCAPSCITPSTTHISVIRISHPALKHWKITEIATSGLHPEQWWLRYRHIHPNPWFCVIICRSSLAVHFDFYHSADPIKQLRSRPNTDTLIPFEIELSEQKFQKKHRFSITSMGT